MEFNSLFPESALEVLDEFPSNEPIVYNEETNMFSLLDTSDLRYLQHRLNEYTDRICTSPDTALRALALQHLLRILFRDDFKCALAAVGILDIATSGKVHERALFVIVELLTHLKAGHYSLLQLHEASEQLAQQAVQQPFSVDREGVPGFYMEL